MEKIDELKEIIEFLISEDLDESQMIENITNLDMIWDLIPKSKEEIFFSSISADDFNQLMRLLDYKECFNSISKILSLICSDSSILKNFFEFANFPFIFTSLSNFFDICNDDYEGEDIRNRIMLIIGNITLYSNENEIKIEADDFYNKMLDFDTNNPFILETKAWLISVLLSCDYPNKEWLVGKAWELATNKNDEISYFSLKTLYLFCSDEYINNFLKERIHDIYEMCTNDSYRLRKESVRIIAAVLDDSLFSEERQQILQCLFDCIHIDKGKAASVAINIIQRFIDEEIFYKMIKNEEFVEIIKDSEVSVKSSFIVFLASIGSEYSLSGMFCSIIPLLDIFLETSNVVEMFSVLIIIGKFLDDEKEDNESVLSFVYEKRDSIIEVSNEYEVPKQYNDFYYYIEKVIQICD